MPAKPPSAAIDLAKLPSGPRVLSRLVSLVNQPQVHLAEVAELFRADPALTARVIAACNSPYYGGEQRTTDIRDAVLRLGLREISHLVHVVTMTDLRKYPTHLYHYTAGYFWERSLHTAYLCEELDAGSRLAFTTGIMHLVGVWALCTVFPGGQNMPIVARELILQAELEQLRLGLDFAEAGSQALAQWGFDPGVCRAVAWQVAPSIGDDPEARELARLLQRAVAATDWHYGAQNEKSLLRSDLTITDLEECNQRAAAKVARIGFGF